MDTLPTAKAHDKAYLHSLLAQRNQDSTPQPEIDAAIEAAFVRTVAMLVNEAADAVQQGVCTPDGADAAMKLGVNYPQGPFEWLARWPVPQVVALLDALDVHYRGERYRVSPWLRARARAIA